ncbi:efflux RND transporter permease subunit [Arcobacter sp. FWKO B]|uniref:efflux RND transporter permease subunit n=1 Tax=Arcobacter sp. FWKO B TaxID=2593672 RepID=UPI0018A42AE8|nr:efflux RND transporter permease subunit [Arcobacter sp. FWKO B]QOG11340.1 efflux RND transporter permease subunit [Arcobacter sp. FWKO B]
MVEKLVEFGLKKPILNHMLLLFLFVVSIFSYINIPKEIFPPSKLDSISISGNYLGASSDILDKIAVSKIEENLINLNSTAKITSTISNGYFSIIAELKDGYNAKDVIDDVKNIVTLTRVNLPNDMDEPIVKAIEYTFPLITVALYGDRTFSQMLDIANILKNDLIKKEDLSEVIIRGDGDEEVVIDINNSKLEALGIDKVSLINAINNISTINPIGTIKEQDTHYYLSTSNGTTNIDELENTLIKVGETSLYLKDIATIELGYSQPDTISRFNSNRNISISISKGENGDSIELVKEIKNLLKTYESKYPDLTFDTYTDTSIWIKNRLNNVVSNILFGIILLFLALFYFINIRIAIVVAIGIPTSFMIGLIGAEQFGFSLNMLTLLGALIALGMLVDEAIVVGENIYRHMENGKDHLNAAIDGTIEMYPAVLTATATTIFAFLPILMMTGQVGKFMQVLPIMIAILLFSSLLEAFFFLPLHAKQIFKVNKEVRKSDMIWEKNKKIYMYVLNKILSKRLISLFSIVLLIIIATFILFKNMKFQFMPNFDTTQVYISGSVGTGNTLEQTEEKVKLIEDLIMKNIKFGNDISSISSIVGLKLDGQNQPMLEEFYFHIFVNLREKAPSNFVERFITPYLSPKYDATDMVREKTALEIKEEVLQAITPLLSGTFDELKVFVPQTGIVKNDIEVAFSGKEAQVYEGVKLLKQSLASINGVSNIDDDLLDGNVELKLKPNQYGQMLGISEGYLLQVLKPLYFKGEYAKMISQNGIVKLKLQSHTKDSITNFEQYKIQIPNRPQMVHLVDVVDIYESPAYSQIYKENGIKINSVTAVLDGKKTSHEVFLELEDAFKQMPFGINVEIKGEEQEGQKVKKEMLRAFLISILLIFIALIWMFDSVVKSLIVLSTIPLSVFGVLLGHYIMGLNISMTTLIGIVGLAGVIVNDGVIMMDFIKKAKNIEEIKEYALLRLRPILITSITTFLGLFTLIFFASGQALILQPLAVALGFGLLWATILNLYFVPLVYSLVYFRK